MKEILEGSGGRAKKFIDSDDSVYVAVIEKGVEKEAGFLRRIAGLVKGMIVDNSLFYASIYISTPLSKTR